MGNLNFGLKDTSEIVNALKRSVRMKQSANQQLEQRVSFVYGLLSSDSSVTREQVRQALAKDNGVTA